MPEANGNRFSPITPDDQAGSIWITTLLCLIYSVLVLVVRVNLRRKVFGPDDWLVAGATIAQVGEVAAVIAALHHGIGQSISHLSAAERSAASQATFASLILFILAACLAKCSTLWLLIRLFNVNSRRSRISRRNQLHWWICCATLGLMAVWGVLSIVALSVKCSPQAFTRIPATTQCPDQLLRWRLISAFDVITEGLMILLSVFIVWPVQMSFELKLQVIIAFVFRLPVAALAILRVYLVGRYVHSATPGLDIVPVLVCQQVELCWSLISATIPALKSFVKSFNSGFGLTLDPDTTARYGSRGYGAGGGFELRSVGKGKSILSSKGSRNATLKDGEDRITDVLHRKEKGNGRDVGSINGMSSQDHIIRKDVQWEIHYEQ